MFDKYIYNSLHFIMKWSVAKLIHGPGVSMLEYLETKQKIANG